LWSTPKGVEFSGGAFPPVETGGYSQ
jgi:hypothetical protein